MKMGSALLWVSCSPVPPFQRMEEVAISAEHYLSSGTNLAATQWREFLQIFPSATVHFSIHESHNNPQTLVWATARAETNNYKISYATPLYFDGASWTHRLPRWSVQSSENATAGSNVELKQDQWEQWRESGFEKKPQP